MSSKHLTAGSVDPPRTEGLLRLYSMIFCPYAKRTRFVLKAKNLPHEIINVNLHKKPEWLWKYNEKALVPVLLDGDKTLTESLDISDYLDEKYPENPLYPSDALAKKRDQELIQKINSALVLFARCLYKNEQNPPDEWVKLFVDAFLPFEEELAKRGTVFFGGEKPGMVDYMLAPWAECTGMINIKLGQKLPFQDNDIPLLRKWRKDILNFPLCSELYIGAEKIFACIQSKLNGEEPKYDE